MHTAEEERNIRTVVAFYDTALNQQKPDAALKYLGDRYIQHNPLVADGPEGFLTFIKMMTSKFPRLKLEIKRIFADGNFVILHVHSRREPDQIGSAIIEIFKLEDGKIVEHWDAIQPIPEQSANQNSMF